MADTFELKKYVGGKAKVLTVTVEDDGSLRIDATKFPGSADEIMKELGELAQLAGGGPQALKIERHIHGAHAHTGTEVHQH